MFVVCEAWSNPHNQCMGRPGRDIGFALISVGYYLELHVSINIYRHCHFFTN